MKSSKAKKLARAGWRVGTTQDFLGLSDEEAAFLEIRLALSGHVRATREQRGVTQVELAERLGSSQSRVAKVEAGDPSVSTDLMLRCLIALGVTGRQLGALLSRSSRQR